MSCSATMGCMIMPCLGLKPGANLQKIFMLDKMEPDHIFSLMVRLLGLVMISVSLITLSLWYCLGLGATGLHTQVHSPMVNEHTSGV